MGSSRPAGDRAVFRDLWSKIYPATPDQMDPTIRIHQSTGLPAPPGNPSTWPHAHETPPTPDPGGPPPIRHTRSGKTRRTTTYGTTYGTSKTIRSRPTPTSTRIGPQT